MKEMLQGEGIIDIVNSYLKIALDSGFIGLAIFFGFFATILIGLRRVAKMPAVGGVDLRVYASGSFATLSGILVIIATVSSIDFVPYLYWSFAGLCVALIRIAYRERALSHIKGVSRADLPRMATSPSERQYLQRP
jgi:O-antigen ligase